MSKMKVQELAKKMGLENKELLAKLADAGIDAASQNSILSEDDVQKFEAQQKASGEKIEEARIKPGLIRRRKTVVREADESADAEADHDEVDQPAVAESPVAEVVAQPEGKASVKPSEPVARAVVEPAAPEVAAPAEKPPVEVAAPVAGKPAAQPEVKAQAVAEPVAELKAESKPKAVPVAEQATAVQATVRAEKPKKEHKTVDRPSGDQAKILGRVDLSQVMAPPGARGGDRQSRPARPGGRPERPAGRTERPAGRPERPVGRPERTDRPDRGVDRNANPSAAPRKRVDVTGFPPPMDQPLPEKEGARTNKKRKKGRRDEGDFDESDGRVSRRGRRVEVFEPGRLAGKKKRGKQGKQLRQTEVTISKAIKRVIRISDSITVGELAKRMGVKANELIAELMRQGSMVTINHPLDYESAAILASEFHYEVENIAFDEESILEVVQASGDEESSEDREIRPPVVTIMGHVDHGKTSLLDAIRAANVTEGEAGGITQHIGAYDVEIDGGKITFLDTPGHEAFTAMRARGAGVTDIVILVVAADDGVMPQTKEAINHSKAAGVPIIVAINKIDKPEANPDRVKQELTEFELVPEDWGGDTIYVEVSAKQKLNLDTLLEMILLQAEVLELKANPTKRAKGSIVEARLDKGRGPVATVLVQDGTLKIGDSIVAGQHFGRVRSMTAANGKQVKEAGPSFPVEVTGLGGVPDAGDTFHAVENEKAAKDVAQHRQSKQREIDLAKSSKVSLDQLFARMQEGVVEELPVIIKADVQGSVEAVRDALEKLSTAACRLNVIHTGVGGVSESDVTLATASNAIILGFNVRPEAKAKTLAENEKVDIRLYSVIYDAVNDVRDAMEGLLAPTLKEKELGRVEIRETFHVSRVGTIAGCYVLDGKILRNAQTRLVRDNVVVWEGKLNSLKRFKDDVREVASGYECGIGLENYNDIKVGDILEVFEMEEVKTSL